MFLLLLSASASTAFTTGAGMRSVCSTMPPDAANFDASFFAHRSSIASSAPEVPGGIALRELLRILLGDEAEGGEFDVGEPVLVADLVVVGDQHRAVVLA